MAFTSRFFNSTQAGDTGYGASEFAGYFKSLVSNGVLYRPDVHSLEVTLTAANMTASIAPGVAFINGYMGEVYDAAETLTLDIGASLDRTDAIVMRFDATVDKTGHQRIGSIYPAVVKGTPGGSAPTPTRTNDVWELCLAQVTVKAGTTNLAAAVLKDTRTDASLCGLAAFYGEPPSYYMQLANNSYAVNPYTKVEVITTSKQWVAPVTGYIDMWMVGGGGGGGYVVGGGGGLCRLVRGISVTKGVAYNIEIGAGGVFVYDYSGNSNHAGTTGGTTSAFGFSVPGGTGGTIIGGDGSNGGAGTYSSSGAGYNGGSGGANGGGPAGGLSLCSSTNPYNGKRYAPGGTGSYSGHAHRGRPGYADVQAGKGGDAQSSYGSTSGGLPWLVEIYYDTGV